MPLSEKPSILFVHGLWADGSCWSEVIPPLQGEGYNVIAVQNPLTSLQDDVAAVKRALDRAGGPAILVGHSWGGFVITASGTDDRVKGLVYVAALGPDTGESVVSAAAKFDPTAVFKHVAAVDGFIWLNRDALPHFAGDLSEPQQDLIYATQGPASAAMIETKLEGEPAWKTKRMGATIVEVDSSHVPMISHPDIVVDLIKKAAKASGA
jgi:pimeloyl-ACP methyl ester carboxylesterase